MPNTNHNQLTTSVIFYWLWLQFSKKIEFLVFYAIKYEFNFDVLCNPIDIIMNQIQFLLPIFPVVHCEWCHFVRPRYFIPRHKSISKVLYRLVNGS